MRIIIDGRMMSESGIGRYIRNLIFNLRVLDKKNEYIFLQRETVPFSWYGIEEQIRLPGLLKSLRGDLVHFPHFNVPILYRGKFVVTIHDLIHQHFSMQRATTHGPIIYQIKQAGYRKVFQNAVNKSQKILAPSNFVKKQLIEECGIAPQKIVVTEEAVDDEIIKLSKVTTKFNIKYPYIFYVGNAHPHKNVEGLIKAFLVLQKKQDLKLILAGSDHYFWQRIKKKYQNKEIIYKGEITDEELVALYKGAECFVLPSYEEGFGIPILEAMACSCPVVSSNRGSLPEVGGNACLYFDPEDQDDIVGKIGQVLKSRELKKELIAGGKKRVKHFSWKRLARQTLEVYENCDRS